jgi:hypothetical protein
MKRLFVSILVMSILTLFCMNQSAYAHHFFVSVTETKVHPPGHITVNLGWGHALPMDDFLTGDKIGTYAVYDPDLRKMEFPFDLGTNKGVENSKGKEYPGFPGGTMLEGDAYCRQVLFKKDAPQGTYQVVATQKKTQFTSWIDNKGKKRWSRQPLDQIKGAREIKVSIIYQSFARAFTTVGKWTQPKALGHDLELIPLTDLSQVHVGDVVSFKVLFMGKLLQSKGGERPEIKAFGELYGEGGIYGLRGMVYQGVAKIRVPASGRWLVTLFLRRPVPKELEGKCLEFAYNASVTFHVK